jgi:hypothetical protein
VAGAQRCAEEGWRGRFLIIHVPETIRRHEGEITKNRTQSNYLRVIL